jgi:hypothetical protein
VQKIIDESERIASVIDHLRSIDKFETEDYLPGEKMIKIPVARRRAS